MTTPAYPEDSRIELLSCPYNKSHQIQRNRMQTHLIKCRKSYPEISKVACPFNVTHLIKEPELSYHVSICADRASFEKFKIQDDLDRTDETRVITYELTSDQNWDSVCVEKTYNPRKYMDSANLIRHAPAGAKPSERKEFRAAEFKRHKQ
ncbi:GTSF1 family protein [Megaselia abdita]